MTDAGARPDELFFDRDLDHVPPGWPEPHEVSRYLQAASEAKRGEGEALAIVVFAIDPEQGGFYDVTLLHGGNVDTALFLRRLEWPKALWEALEDIAAACPRSAVPPVPRSTATHRHVSSVVLQAAHAIGPSLASPPPPPPDAPTPCETTDPFPP